MHARSQDREVAQTVKTLLLLYTGLDTHPARMNTHLYTVYGGATQDQGQYVYLIDEYKK